MHVKYCRIEGLGNFRAPGAIPAASTQSPLGRNPKWALLLALRQILVREKRAISPLGAIFRGFLGAMEGCPGCSGP